MQGDWYGNSRTNDHSSNQDYFHALITYIQPRKNAEILKIFQQEVIWK